MALFKANSHPPKPFEAKKLPTGWGDGKNNLDISQRHRITLEMLNFVISIYSKVKTVSNGRNILPSTEPAPTRIRKSFLLLDWITTCDLTS